MSLASPLLFHTDLAKGKDPTKTFKIDRNLQNCIDFGFAGKPLLLDQILRLSDDTLEVKVMRFFFERSV